MTSVEYAHFGLLILFSATGSLSDLAHRRISNMLCLACAICGLGLAFAAGDLFPHFLHSAIALLLGLGLFGLRMVGGGDAKFYAALASFFSYQSAVLFGLAIAVTGGLLALGVLTAGYLKRDPERSLKAHTLPYGVAIGLGAIVCQLALLL